MRYLLVGNGPVSDEFDKRVQRADLVVQINDCRYADRVAPEKTRYVFILNADRDTSPKVIKGFLSKRRFLPNVTVILPLSPTFAQLKQVALRLRRNWNWRYCRTSSAWKALRGLYPIRFVPFFSRLILELTLVRNGMPPSYHPSTGMVAYDWLRRRLHPRDSLEIDGFTFEGWNLHAWHVEKQLIRPIEGVDELDQNVCEPHICNLT